jgi:hypothetical protein
MNRLHRYWFFFAATATLLAACCTTEVIPTSDTGPRKTIKADGRGGIVEHDEKLQLVQPTDGFTAIGAPKTEPIIGAKDAATSAPERVSPNAMQRKLHIKYNNSVLFALGADTSKANAAPTNNQNAGYLRYRIWVPTDDSANIGHWSDWTKSNDPKGPDTDNSKPPLWLSGTLLEPGKWHLVSPAPSPDKTITIQATVNGTQYTWTGAWSRLTKNGSPDPTERGSITWTVSSP